MPVLCQSLLFGLITAQLVKGASFNADITGGINCEKNCYFNLHL